MAADFAEVANLRQELTIARTELKHAEHDIADIKNSVNSSIQNNSSNASSLRSEISSLQSQINSIISKINNIGSSVSSGNTSADQAVKKYNTLSQTVSQFTKRLNSYITGGGNDVDRIRNIANEFVDNFNSV